MSEFTHINHQGNAKMVDVSEKNISKQIVEHTNQKGNVLNTAQIAGIMAAKNTADIIPMCHPLPLTGIDVTFDWQENEQSYTLNIQTIVSTTGKTGVEMEALTAATAVALTVYDMTKALDKSMVIGETYLLSKSGGKSGDYQRQDN